MLRTGANVGKNGMRHRLHTAEDVALLARGRRSGHLAMISPFQAFDANNLKEKVRKQSRNSIESLQMWMAHVGNKSTKSSLPELTN